MRYFIVALVLLIFTAPPPLVTIEPADGVFFIGWDNSRVHADTVIARLNRDDCPIAARAAPIDTGDPRQALTQVPEGPPFVSACLLRPGDNVMLERWRDGAKIDEIGPFVVPVRIYVPMINK